MVFAPVDPAIREKVIASYLAGNGKGRNQITRELHGQGIKVSHGSVSNIINAYKRKHEQPSKTQVCPELSVSNAGISSGTPMGSSSSVVTPRDGGPLSHLLNEDRMVNPDSIVTNTNPPQPDTDMENIDFDEHSDPDSEPEIEVQKLETPRPRTKTRPKLVDSNPEKSIDEKLEQERVAWDYYGPAWMWILNQISREKDQRRHELLVIDRRKQKLEEWRKRLEQRESNLKDRQTRVFEAEPFLSVAKQLQNLGIGMEEALPWIEILREKAEAENVDIRRTSINVAQELRLYRQSGGIQKQFERANQELALVNMATIQKQQALTVLIDLLNRGVTESQIVQLINFAGEWNKYWQSSTTNGNGNLQQLNNNPVNGSNNPGSSDGNCGNFSINDLIRLNLLKSTNTNILRRPYGPEEVLNQ
jgi:hypothetical protein